MTFTPAFPTKLHEDAAAIVKEYFLAIPCVDTILIVNSCARGRAVPESDLDMAILVNPETPASEIKGVEKKWETYSTTQATILAYKQLSPFAHLHLDITTCNFEPTGIEAGGPIDSFEIEIGNQICYSAPMGNEGTYFKQLKTKWLPYYPDELHLERLEMVRNACIYNLDHIPFLVKRGLYFHALDILYKSFQEYLQALFIANKIYPIAYNKWIKEQLTNYLHKPGLYPKLSPILSVKNIESNEMNKKAKMLRQLLDNVDAS
jgi:predicted nucleotidyltransferase